MTNRHRLAALSVISILCSQLPTLQAFAAQTSADSLIGYWKLDENAAASCSGGTDACDASGEGKHSTWHGAGAGSHTTPAWTSSISGTIKFNDPYAMDFDGTDDYLSRSDTFLPTGSGSRSFSAWFKTSSITNNLGILMYGKNVDNQEYYITLTNTADCTGTITTTNNHSAVTAGSRGTGNNVCDDVAVNDGAWHHLATTYDGTTHKLYVDGVLKSSRSQNMNTTSSGADAFTIGKAAPWGGSNFPGQIDDVRAYSRVLSPGEIAQLAAGNHIQAFWKGGNGTGFENKNNWSGSYIPDPYSRLVIRATATAPLALTGSIKAAALTINTGALMNLNGTGFTMNDSGLFTNYGTLALRNTETLTGFTNDTSKGTIMIIGSGSTTGLKTGNSYYNLTLNDGLVGYWKLNETSGTRAADSSGYGNSGSLVNGPTVSTAVAPTGFYDPRSLSFDGADDYVSLPDVAVLQPSNVSVGAWFKTTSSNFQVMLRKRWNGYSLYVSNGQVVGTLWEDGSHDLWVTSPVTTYNDGRWHHAMLTYNGTVESLYVDGSLVSVTVGTGTHAIYYAGGAISIGRDGDADTGYFNGNIDDVRVYDRALVTGEVAALAAGNEPSTAKGTVTLNNDLTVNNTLKLNGGTLDVSSSNYNVTIGGSLLNNGSIITARKGRVTFNGTTAGMEILTGGQRLNNVTLNGAGATWNTRDPLTASGTLTLSAGTLDASGSYVIRSGNVTQTSGTFVPRSGAVVLTSSADATSIFTGTLNALRVEDPSENGLIAYWKFDGGTNTGAILDSSGHNNTGIRHGTGAVWSGSTLPTNIGFTDPFSMKFNGYTTVVRVPSSSRLQDWSNGYTYSIWVKRTALNSNEQGIMTYGSETDEGVAMVLLGNQPRFWLPGYSIMAGTAINDTNWHLLTGVFDNVNDTLKLYVDGSLDASAAETHSPLTPTGSFLIGNETDDATRGFKGLLDDARVYNRALSAGEVTNLYRGHYAAGGSSTAAFSMGDDVSMTSLHLDSGVFESSHDVSVSNTLNMQRGGGDIVLGAGLTTLGGLTLSGAVFHATSGTLDVNGNVAFLTGSLSLPSGTTSISGDWNHAGGTFDANGGTVVLDGGDQTLSGSTIFYNLTKTVTSRHNLVFAAGKTFSVPGALTLNGTDGNYLSLRSTSEGTQWNIDPSGARTIAYLDVRDSNNTNVTAIDCIGLHCINNGRNGNWLFTSEDSGSSSSTGGGTVGWSRGHGTSLESALRAKAVIVESYKRALAVESGGTSSGSTKRNVAIPDPLTQPTNDLPSKVGTYAIGTQRNRVVLQTDDVRLIYKDVIADSWYAPFVASVIKDNIARGYQGKDGKLTGEFGVQNSVTHAEILKMALEAADKADIKAPPSRNKSAANTWAAPFVSIAEQLQLSVYTPSLDVNKPATRGEVTQTIMEVFGLTIGNTPSTFTDVPKNHPYTNAIAAATFFGIVEGDTDANGNPLNTFRPDQPINRAEVSKLIALARALKNMSTIAPAAVGGMEASDSSSSASSVSSVVSSVSSSLSSSSVSSKISSTSSASLQTQAKVLSKRLNVRADSRVDALKITTIYSGQTATILWSQKNGWSYIRTSAGQEGYVKSEFLELMR